MVPNKQIQCWADLTLPCFGLVPNIHDQPLRSAGLSCLISCSFPDLGLFSLGKLLPLQDGSELLSLHLVEL